MKSKNETWEEFPVRGVGPICLLTQNLTRPNPFFRIKLQHIHKKCNVRSRCIATKILPAFMEPAAQQFCALMQETKRKKGIRALWGAIFEVHAHKFLCNEKDASKNGFHNVMAETKMFSPKQSHLLFWDRVIVLIFRAQRQWIDKRDSQDSCSLLSLTSCQMQAQQGAFHTEKVKMTIFQMADSGATSLCHKLLSI